VKESFWISPSVPRIAVSYMQAPTALSPHWNFIAEAFISCVNNSAIGVTNAK